MSAILAIKNKNYFFENGYLLKNSFDYEVEESSKASTDLINEFNYLELDQSPGSRYRGYLKLNWYKISNILKISNDQNYYQTYDANTMHGGKIRKFKILPERIFKNKTLQKIIYKNIKFINKSNEFTFYEDVIFGIHFIRYYALESKVSYSSPIWLHMDDEPLVFVHLIQITENLIGGDNIIAGPKGEIKHVLRLKNFMDTLILNQNTRHAVTPMGSTEGVALRDIILFTVEPSFTNQERKS